jgi:peptide/nickel transport system substrate-binding protein
MPIYSEAAVEAVGGLDATDRNAPVGCGRYELKEWKSGEYVLVERNENYWDDSYVGYYKYIKFIGIPDAASRSLAVQSGDANVAYKISTTDYVMLEMSPMVDGLIMSDIDLYNLGFNCSSEKLSDPKVREALAYAVDAESVNMIVNMGRGKVAQGLYPESFPFYHEVYEGGHLPFDPAKAKQLLADAGIAEGTLTLRFITLAANANIATIIQESMRQAGVNVEIEIEEQSVYVQDARGGNYDLQVISTSLGTVQPNCFNQVSPSQVGKAVGNCRITDPAMAEMCERAASSDPDAQAQGFNDIIDYVFNNYCLVGLCTQNKYSAVTAGIEGLTTGNRMSYIDVSYMHK